jgi:hypothetical protein
LLNDSIASSAVALPFPTMMRSKVAGADIVLRFFFVLIVVL